MLVVRLKVVADKLTEIELVATRSRAEGLIFNIDGLKARQRSDELRAAPRAAAPRARRRCKAALKYPEGLNAREDLRRRERAVRARRLSLRERPDHGRPRLQVRSPAARTSPRSRWPSSSAWATDQTRVVAVDERMGIVWLRLAWGVRKEGGDQLTAFEAFKVYDGQIHAVEAFMRILPIEKREGVGNSARARYYSTYRISRRSAWVGGKRRFRAHGN